MSASRSTSSDHRGFVFSLDSAIAGLVFMGIVILLLFPPFQAENTGSLQATQLVDDCFAMLQSSGYLMRVIDSNAPSDAANNIREMAAGLLPENLALRIELKQYNTDMESCRSYKSFEKCFPEEDIITASSGPAIPGNKELIHGRKIVMKNQAPSDCNISYLVFSGSEKPEKEKLLELFFAEREKIFLQDGGDINIAFGVSVEPSDKISCNADVNVTVTAYIPGGARKPVDVMLVIDRSSSMDEYSIAPGNGIHYSQGSLGGGTRPCVSWFFFTCLSYEYRNWKRIADFNITNESAFDVLFRYKNWQGGRPKLYIQAPDDTNYGYYGGAPADGWYIPENDYNYVYIAVPSDESQNGTWKVWAWDDDPPSDYNLTIKTIDAPITKLDAAKEAAKFFVDHAEWTKDDYTGLASFATTGKVDNPLTSNRTAVKNKIDTLKADGYTAIGEGIYTATGELMPRPVGHGRENAMSLQVLLSDSKTNRGRPSADAANDAKDKNITIFTVGLGVGADEHELSTIAQITGGEYYFGGDANSLQGIYDIIARKIQESATDINVTIPIPRGAILIDYGEGYEADGNLLFWIESIDEPWEATYTINFPCSSQNNCNVETVTFPGEGAAITYYDSNGIVHTADFNASITIEFLTRDMRVDIYGGKISGADNVYLDVNVFNAGDLNTGESTLNFRLGDVNGAILASTYVPSLCGLGDGCQTHFRMYPSVNIGNEGVIYATVNDDNSISECPLGNYDAVNCYGAPSLQYYVIDYYVWRE